MSQQRDTATITSMFEQTIFRSKQTTFERKTSRQPESIHTERGLLDGDENEPARLKVTFDNTDLASIDLAFKGKHQR